MANTLNSQFDPPFDASFFGDLSRRVGEMEDRLRRLEGIQRVNLSGRQLAEIKDVTRTMFSEPTITVECDPENPAYEFVVVTVVDNGPDVISKRMEWHRRMDRIAPDTVGTLRLSIRSF